MWLKATACWNMRRAVVIQGRTPFPPHGPSFTPSLQPGLPPAVTEGLGPLVDACLRRDPASRPSAGEVVQVGVRVDVCLFLGRV